MEIAEADPKTGVLKSSTSASESSKEVSVEQTSNKAQQSIEQKSSEIVKKEVSSSVLDAKISESNVPREIKQLDSYQTPDNLNQEEQVTTGKFFQSVPKLGVNEQQQAQTFSAKTSSEINQDNIKTTLKEIISDIDRVIEQEEDHTSKTSTTQEMRDEYGYLKKNENYEVKETSATSKGINLQKIFTPANDAEEIPPKNRKLYSSSAFYSSNLHPTVEDQVELARMISHSLSDISNQQSKGQSMYENRKKRSVKWVHEGEGKAENHEYIDYEESKENNYGNSYKKVPLKLVMNPRGQIRDFSSIRPEDIYTQTGLLSPDKCAELVSALNAPKGKGAELFAKRRKKSENWVVEDTSNAFQSSSVVSHGLPTYTPPCPASSYNQIQDNYNRMPQWQPASEKEYASQTYQNTQKSNSLRSQQNIYDYEPSGGNYFPSTDRIDPNVLTTDSYKKPETHSRQPYNSQRDLAYKPSVPQGWKAPPPSLPKDDSSFSSAISSSGPLNGNIIESMNCIRDEKDFKYSSFEKPLKLTNYGINLESFEQTDEDEIVKYLEKSLSKKQNHFCPSLLSESSVHQNEEFMPKLPELSVSDSTLAEHKTDIIKKQNTYSAYNGECEVKIRIREKNDIFVHKNSDSININHEISNPKNRSEIAQKTILEKTGLEEEYIKIPVKDLISSFENQSPDIRAERNREKARSPKAKELKNEVLLDANKDSINYLKEMSLIESYNQQSEDVSPSELYVPKEIPLDSYVPPPNEKFLPPSASTYTSPSPYSYSSFPSYNPLPAEQQQSYSFPVSNQSNNIYQTGQQRFSVHSNQKLGNIKQNNWQAQKLQINPPIAFNPSPLPYDKLSKFEQTDTPDPYICSWNQPIRSPLSVSFNKNQNTSPTPFGSSSLQSKPSYSASNYPKEPRLTSKQYQNEFKQRNYLNDENRYESQSVSSKLSSIDLSNCQNFNAVARGWGRTSEVYRPGIVNHPKVELPYTDF